jgi:hypothetical protein
MAGLGKLSGGSLRGRRYPQQDTVCESFCNTLVLPASLTLPCKPPPRLPSSHLSLVVLHRRSGDRCGTPSPASPTFVRTSPTSSRASICPSSPLDVAVSHTPASPCVSVGPLSERRRHGRARPPLSPAAAQARAAREASHRLSFLRQQGAGAAFDFLHAINLRAISCGLSSQAKLECSRPPAPNTGGGVQASVESSFRPVWFRDRLVCLYPPPRRPLLAGISLPNRWGFYVRLCSSRVCARL